jgi:hypothetical protein
MTYDLESRWTTQNLLREFITWRQLPHFNVLPFLLSG